MSEPRRGEVVLVRFPFGEDMIVAGIFSNVPPTLRATGLLISVIASTIGALPSAVFHAVIDRVKTALGLA